MFALSVVTLEKLIFEGEVKSVTAPGGEGYLQLLVNHAPIITTLLPGKLSYVTENDKFLYAVSGGFLEMSHNSASVLADAVELAEEIDIKRAEASLREAQSRLELTSSDASTDLVSIKSAIKRAENRIKIYREFKAKTTHPSI
ncbi:MAG: ATP synthase F1 subunit epsilon [Parachlamydiaceae bacterium]|nr:ATP synthase F1 subunit epsilon [Parachlamydiaceae bacterium]